MLRTKVAMSLNVRGARLGVLLALVTALAACGGGGDGVASTPMPTSGPPAASVGPLRDAATGAGKWVGAAVQSGYIASEPDYVATLSRHFSYLTAEYEMKWDPIQREQGVFDFSGGDAIVAFAEANGMRVKGHALVWHGATPPWVGTLSPPELRDAMANHIRTVASHYRGHVAAWDVVNEAIATDGSGLRDTVFSRGLGPDYIAAAFRTAREADPGALLFYNEYDAEGKGLKSDRVYELVQGLKQGGVPIDGVGMQMHVDATSYPQPADIAANMQRLAALGLLVNISEMDVRIRTAPGSTAQRLDLQKHVFHDIVAVCAAEARCHAVTFWGFSDKHSWIDAFFGADNPLLFDEGYRAKPAFFGVEDAFLGR
jgi:endo-1,4-beta-xylanase